MTKSNYSRPLRSYSCSSSCQDYPPKDMGDRMPPRTTDECKIHNKTTSLEIRVPTVYSSWANVLFLAFSSFNEINKLCVIGQGQNSDSPRLDHSSSRFQISSNPYQRIKDERFVDFR
jgi:hypothetical protein